MKIASASIRTINIPFISAFQHSLASRNETESIILEVVTDSGISGFGECTPRNYVTGETIASTIAKLQEIIPHLMELEFTDPIGLLAWLDEFESNFRNLSKSVNAVCAMELAMLDALGKELNKPIVEFFDRPRKDQIFYSGVIASGTPETTKKILPKIKSLGFRQIKVKIGKNLQRDIENIQMVRAFLGSGVEIRVDANAAWNLEQAVENIKTLSGHGVRIIEQPLPKEQRDDYPRLMAEFNSDISIIIDESISTVADATWFIENRGAAGFNLKISKHGGLLNSLKIYRLAQENGLSCRLGCHVGETSLLTAAGMVFTGIAENLMAYEGAFGSHLLEYDITENPLQFRHKGKMNLADLRHTPGLGIQISPALLNKATAQVY